MYTSPLFAKVIYRIYTSSTWKSAMSSFFRDVPSSPNPERSPEDDWMRCPPPTVVAFAGTLVNARFIVLYNF
jgi:hypothetical protein